MPAQTMTSDRAAPAVVRGNLRDPVPAAQPGDSQLTTTAQMALDHNCAFWNNLSPKP